MPVADISDILYQTSSNDCAGTRTSTLFMRPLSSDTELSFFSFNIILKCNMKKTYTIAIM